MNFFSYTILSVIKRYLHKKEIIERRNFSYRATGLIVVGHQLIYWHFIFVICSEQLWKRYGECKCFRLVNTQPNKQTNKKKKNISKQKVYLM